MQSIEYAILKSGKKVPYIYRPDPPCGGMKHTFFAPDKSYVVQFFNDFCMSEDIELHKRLDAIIGRYNPTISEEEGGASGNTEALANYFSNCFCWPKDIVVEPEFGIICPTYPKKFFFDETASDVLNLRGKDKISTWFTYKNRRYLNKEELGTFKGILQMSLQLARAVRRMHQAGLAHSDLSCNNVLIDPKSGSCIIIDIDTLVVPEMFPPKVIGTRGYIAPEILESLVLPYRQRKTPGIYTDLHSLAVLIYEYIFCRHPLLGKKIYSNSEQENDFLTLGPKALFIEDLKDFSNRPSNLNMTIKDVGSILEDLFLRAFTEGLHNPHLRPTAMEWERGLSQTLDMLYKCPNKNCVKEWFVLYDINNVKCPFCCSKVKDKEIVRFCIKKKLKSIKGQWIDVCDINVYDGMPIYKWHIYDNLYNDEKTDRQVQALIKKENDKWFFINKEIEGVISPTGDIVPKNNKMEIKDKDFFITNSSEHNLLVEVEIIK